MEILITGGTFLGAILGRFFKVLILIPASVFSIVVLVILLSRDFAAYSVLDSLLGGALLIASLEFGYVTGLVSTDISAVVEGFGRFRACFRRPAPARPAQPG